MAFPTVTSITTPQEKSRWIQTGPSSQGYREYYVQADMSFEFYVSGQRWTGRKTVRGDLAKKNKGDSIRVYYVPENPGKGLILDP